MRHLLDRTTRHRLLQGRFLEGRAALGLNPPHLFSNPLSRTDCSDLTREMGGQQRAGQPSYKTPRPRICALSAGISTTRLGAIRSWAFAAESELDNV